jgi:hypothetical protein
MPNISDNYITLNTMDCGAPQLTITADTGKIPVGQTRRFKVTAYYPASASCIGTDAERTFDVTPLVTWTGISAVGSFNSATNQEVFSATKAGKVTGTASYNGGSATYDFEVVDVYVKSLTLSAADTVNKGASIPLTVTTVWTDDGTTEFTGLSTPASDMTWNTSLPTALTVSQPNPGEAKWNATGETAGQTTALSVTYNDGSHPSVTSNVININVVNVCIAEIDSFVTDQGSFDLPAGVPFTLTDISCKDSTGAIVTNCPVEYSITSGAANIDTAFFGVDFATTGKARIATTAASGATSQIRATVTQNACPSGVTHTETLKVTADKLNSIKVEGLSTLPKGVEEEYKATGFYGSKSFNLSYAATWTSLTSTIAQFTSGKNPLVTSKTTGGTTTLRAAYEGVVSLGPGQEKDVTVEDKVPTSLAIKAAAPTTVGGTTDTADIPANGFHVALVATVTYSDGSTKDVTSDADWNLDGALLPGLTLTNNVIQSGSGTGTQKVKAKYSYNNVTKTATFNVTVNSGALESLTIVNANGTAAATDVVLGLSNAYGAVAKLVGSTEQYIVYDGDATFYTSAVTVADFQGDWGVLSGLTLGSTNITVARNGIVSPKVAVTVTNREPTGIECLPDLTLSPGDKGQLHVKVSFTSGDPIYVTEVDSLVSDNTAVADFDPSDPFGVVSAISVGDATITVTWTGTVNGAPKTFTNTCDVEVTQ